MVTESCQQVCGNDPHEKSECKGLSGLISALLLLDAALIPDYQIVLWLKDGYWTPMLLVLAFG